MIAKNAELTVPRLLRAGFVEVSCWSLGSETLNRPSDLPAIRGVYAFAVDDRVLYVGLASRSLKQRLGFYARPGRTQPTNQRLNALIRSLISDGHTVRILIAHPKDGEWHGLRTSGPEGLEAALIEDFGLPWNVRGSAAAVATIPKVSGDRKRRPKGSVPQAIVDFVALNPKCTELQIAKGVFGPDAVQPRVNSYCRKLVERGLLERLASRPATYIAKAR